MHLNIARVIPRVKLLVKIGHDLQTTFMLHSVSSENWVKKRTTFTRSLAVMSMVGYIIGLGDRHPSNLMIDRMTGKLCHIDFGDCFEVAMQRENFPEKIPFRLTRMVTQSMEVKKYIKVDMWFIWNISVDL